MNRLTTSKQFLYSLPFNAHYKCYSVSYLGSIGKLTDVERGGNIIMPASALDHLTHLNIAYPMQFKLTNKKRSRASHCGVLEFTADEGKIYLPHWMMKILLLDEGDMVHIKNRALPVAEFLRFRPRTADFLQLQNPKDVLENALCHFTCLTTGDMIAIDYNDKIYKLQVVETRPGEAVLVNAPDIPIEIETPLMLNYHLPKPILEADRKFSKGVQPKVGKCSFCKTNLNANILLFHEKECVYRPINCPDCSTTVLLKDSHNHSCKQAKENYKVSEIGLLSKNFKDLFMNENCWDTILQVSDKEFKVHRAILAARSPVFSAMFQHDTSEKQTGEVKVPDCDPDSFKEFLEYIYSGELENLSSCSTLNLYTISDKYQVQELKLFCTKYLMQNITTENICDIVILADAYDETELFSAIQDFFNENFKEIVMTSTWENLFKKNFRLANKLLIGKAKAE